MKREKTIDSGVLLALLAGTLTLAVSAASAGKASRDEGLAGWAEGPVRYLLSRSEEKGFHELKDEVSRAMFIVRFWHRHDPTPDTLENETRREFWRRVVDANRRFRESTRPGWMTDRGKIFILLGEPDETIVEESPKVRDTPGGPPLSNQMPGQGDGSSGGFSLGQQEMVSRGLLRWAYRNLPLQGVDPLLTIAFVRDTSGEWRMSGNPSNYSPVFPGLTMETGNVPSLGNYRPPTRDGISIEIPADTPGDPLEAVARTITLSSTGMKILIGMDMGQGTRVPAAAETVGGVVTSAEFLDRIPVVSRFSFFRAADGNTQVRVGASVTPSSLYKDDVAKMEDLSSFLLLYGRFSGQSQPEPLFVSNETNPTMISGEDLKKRDRPVEAWASGTLPPGRYEVSVGLQEAATGVVSSIRDTVEVPDLSRGPLVLSSLVPASQMRQVDGRLIATLRVRPVFRRDEEFGVYYQIYDLAQAEGRCLFDVTYRFSYLGGDAERPVGKPVVTAGLSEPVQGWSVPLEKWPEGPYRLDVTVQSQLSGARATGSLAFEVVGKGR